MLVALLYGRLSPQIEPPILLFVLCIAIALLVWIGWATIEADPVYGIIMMFVALRLYADIFARYAQQHVAYHYAANQNREAFISTLLASRGLQGFISLALIPLALVLTTLQMVTVWVLAIVVSALLVMWMAEGLRYIQGSNELIQPLGDEKSDFRSDGSVRSLFQPGLIRWLTLTTVSVGTLTSIVLFRTIYILGETSNYEFPAMITFFSIINGIGVWLTLPLKYYLLSRLLRQLNAGRLTEIYPGLLTASFAAMMAVPSIVTAGLGDYAQTTLRLSLYDPIDRLLHYALPGGIEGWSRRFMDSYVEPFGHIAGAGIILIATQLLDMGNGPLLLGGILVAVLLIGSTQRTGRLYTQSLASSLQAGQYRLLRHTAGEWGPSDTAGIDQILSELQAVPLESRKGLMIAEVIAQSQRKEGYVLLIERYQKSPMEIRAEMLPIIINGWADVKAWPQNRQLIQDALNSKHPNLRRAALRLVSIYPDLDPDYTVARLLVDPDPEVNIVSAAVLLHHPSDEIRHAARSQLRWLAKHRKAAVRVMAVRALVQGSLDHLGEVVVPIDIMPYLDDPATRVREACLEAATLEQLVRAACDPSLNVRRVAIDQLRERRFQGARRHLQQAIRELENISELSDHLQIDNMVCWWRLHIAVAQLSRGLGRANLFWMLERGFEQLDAIDMMAHTMRVLDEPQLKPVLTQLRHDYDLLLHCMIDLLAAVEGKSHVNTVLWTLRSNEHGAEHPKARRALVHLTNEELAKRFEWAIQDPAGHRERPQSKTPRVVLQTLLTQLDDWRPLITLYAVLRLPQEERGWLDEASVDHLLDVRIQSSIPAIREAARLIQQFWREKTDIQHLGEGPLDAHKAEESKEVVMLSILERMVFLRNVSFFGDLRLDQLKALARVCDEHAYAAGKRIIKQGDVGDGLYVVVEGQVRIERQTGRGTDRVYLFSLGPSEVFGEISLLDGGLRTADIIAETPVLLLGIKRDALDDALDDDPSIAMGMLRAMAQRLRRSTETIDKLSLTESLVPDSSQ
jgi:hypothetical protein